LPARRARARARGVAHSGASRRRRRRRRSSASRLVSKAVPGQSAAPARGRGAAIAVKIARLPALALLGAYALGACDVVRVVGSNDGDSRPGSLACGPSAPLHACASGTCAVDELLAALMGSPTLAADDGDVYFLSAVDVLAKRAIAGGSVVQLAAQLD